MAHGHPPERIDDMAMRDLEALAIYALAPDRVQLTNLGGD